MQNPALEPQVSSSNLKAFDCWKWFEATAAEAQVRQMENVVEGQGWEDGDLKTLGKMPFFSPPNLGRTSKVCRKVEDLLSGFSGAFTTRAS